ncbi:MAG: hypothetical protein LC772_04060, partial [Chloroflexi bacterium]|nr:hypothetical protein [Chloroflexota bacterium]
MNAIQEAWAGASSAEDRLSIIATGGRKAAVRQNRALTALYKEHRTGIWPFCVAQALVRSTHARSDAGWYAAAAKYLKSGDRSDLASARGFSSSFGADALQRALMSFRTLGDFTGVATAPSGPALQLVKAQDRAVQY